MKRFYQRGKSGNQPVGHFPDFGHLPSVSIFEFLPERDEQNDNFRRRGKSCARVGDYPSFRVIRYQKVISVREGRVEISRPAIFLHFLSEEDLRTGRESSQIKTIHLKSRKSMLAHISCQRGKSWIQRQLHQVASFGPKSMEIKAREAKTSQIKSI